MPDLLSGYLLKKAAASTPLVLIFVFHKLQTIKLSINAVMSQQFFVRTGINDFAVVKDINSVRVDYRRQTVRNND